MSRFFSSLRSRLILFLLFAILPALGLMVYTFLEQRREALERLNVQTLRLMQVVAIDAQHFIEGARQLLFTVAQFQALHKTDPATCNRLFSALLKQYPQFANIAAARASDGVVFASAVPMKDPVSVSDRPWFRQTLATRDFTVGEYEIGRITNKPTVNLGYPVIGEKGEIKSVVFAAFDLAWFDQLAQKVPLGKGVIFTLVDDKGTILVRHPESEKWVGKSMLEAGIIRFFLSKGEGTPEIATSDNSSSLYAFTRLPYKGSQAFVSVGVLKRLLMLPLTKSFI